MIEVNLLACYSANTHASTFDRIKLAYRTSVAASTRVYSENDL